MTLSLGRLVKGIRLPTAELVIVLTYVLALASAEAILATVGAIAASLAHAFLVVVMLTHAAGHREERYADVLVGLALAPVMRILSLGVPAEGLPPLAWIGLIGTPTLMGAWVATRALHLSPGTIGVARGDPAVQLGIAAAGLPVGLAAYLILRPEPVISSVSPAVVLAALIAISVFIGFGEEVVFRGVIQGVARRAFGSAPAIAIGATSGAIMLVGSGSLAQVLAFGMLSLAAAVVVERTGSIWGVAGAHSVLSFGVLVLWPILVG